MKIRIFSAALLVCATLPLAGCEFLTPNWDALKPTGSPTTAEPTETPTPTPVPTVDPKLEEVAVVVLNSSADSSGIEVVAQVLNLSENGGTCKLTVSQAGTKKVLEVKAEANITDTQCFPMRLPLTGFGSGPATFVVSYVSGTSKGESSVQALSIP